jgi:hypothetical protein
MLKLRLVALCASLLAALTAHVGVIRFEVLLSDPAFEGRSFGSVGPCHRSEAWISNGAAHGQAASCKGSRWTC